MSARCVSSRTDSMGAWDGGGAGGGMRVAWPGILVVGGVERNRMRRKLEGERRRRRVSILPRGSK